jgi:hypothetical protein
MAKSPSIPLDEDEALYAQRMIAQRCLYGLDKNQMAADLAKVVAVAGDAGQGSPVYVPGSLATARRCAGGPYAEANRVFQLGTCGAKELPGREIRKRIDRATQYRERILNARDNIPYAQLSQELSSADEALNLPRMVGDAAIAAFFSEDKPKKREEARRRMQSLVEADLKMDGFLSVDSELDLAIKELSKGSKGIVPVSLGTGIPRSVHNRRQRSGHRRVRCDHWKSALRWQEHNYEFNARGLHRLAADHT